MLPDKRPLPIRVRPLHHETAASYLQRLVQANFLKEEHGLRYLAAVRKVHPDLDNASAVGRIAEWWGGREEGFFALAEARAPAHGDGSTCDRCTTGLADLHLCRLCAAGATVSQYPHLDGNVCIRHRLWVGPGATPEKQHHVGIEVVAAEQTWLRLVRNGRLDAHRHAELRDLFHLWGRAAFGKDLPDSELHTSLVRVWNQVSNPAFHRLLLDPRRTFAEAYELLDDMVRPLLADQHAVVTDGLWTLLRPAFLLVREQLDGVHRHNQLGPHDLPGTLLTAEVSRPLEPFSRHLDQLRTCAADEWTDLKLRLHDASPRALTREQITVGDSTSARYICAKGHRIEMTPNTLAGALRNGRVGCVYCANLKALSGYNSVLETHPLLALQWHPTKNGAKRPSDVLAGSNSEKYWWQCERLHEFEETPNNRSRGKGCPFCSRSRADPGVTSIDATHPEIAAEFHPNRNGSVTAGMVLSGSGKTLWWVCPAAGHEFEDTPYARTHGRGCSVCAGLKRNENNLERVHPRIARTWHKTRNGVLTPRGVSARESKTKYWWVCEEQHPYDMTVSNRVAGKGCRYCANQEPLTGWNTLGDTQPWLAAEWHPTKNGGATPYMFVAGSSKKAWWLCRLGHDFEQAIVKRLDGQGCQYCGNKKVWPGYNDATTRYPDLILDWDWDNNDGVDPSLVLPGNGLRTWRCKHGHEQHQAFPNRSKTKGCTRCPAEQRVGSYP